jgi:hypothetical protein
MAWTHERKAKFLATMAKKKKAKQQRAAKPQAAPIGKKRGRPAGKPKRILVLEGGRHVEHELVKMVTEIYVPVKK